MATQSADSVAYVEKAATRDLIEYRLKVAIGATGAVGTTTVDDPGVTITRTGVGTYNLTYPAGQDVFIDFQLLAADATPTAASFVTTAESPTAGTATFVAINGTAAAEIESGSTLKLCIKVTSRAN
jgi:hypothetical protein